LLVKAIIEAARDRLGHSDSTGWSDDRLLRLVNAAQKDICKRTSIYRRKAYIALGNNKTLYSLPDDCYDIMRIEYVDSQLPIFSREDIDNAYSEPGIYAIKSNINRGLLEIHPPFTDLNFFENYYSGTQLDIIEGIESVEGVASSQCMDNVEGVIVGITETYSDESITLYGGICGSNVFTNTGEANSNNGVISDIIPYGKDDSYGFLSRLNDNVVEGTYGICIGFVYNPNYVTVFYNATPPKIYWLNGSTVLEDLWFDAFIHYIVGIARQDDNDEGNYKIGELELRKYEVEVQKARKITAKSFNSQQNNVRETIYRRF